MQNVPLFEEMSLQMKGISIYILCFLFILIKMNLIKNLVSRNKNRIDVNNNSLDVSFITSRVLAMSFPSDNIVESLIHNNIDEISLFLTRGISTTTLSITYQALTTIAANSTTTSLSLNGQTTKLLLSSISSPSAKTL